MAWECEDEAEISKKIIYQEYDATSNAQPVGSLYSIASHDLGQIVRNVSISANSSGTINFYYEYLGNIYNKLKTGGSWSTYNRGAGKYPSSVFNALQNGVWTTYTSAPYLLKSENLQNYLSKNTLAEVEAFKRFYYPL
ncbi:MAG: hypothetical protein GXO77_12525, partial [Calditrichaeota bacterium]|nr:hypothetical protein [Calditrichota bacterium]